MGDGRGIHIVLAGRADAGDPGAVAASSDEITYLCRTANAYFRETIEPEHVVRLARRAGSTPDDARVLEAAEDPMSPMRSVAGNPIIRFVADALRFYFEFHRTYDGFYGAFIHDPLVVAAALDPALVTSEPLFVDVETRGEITTGMTVADRRRLTGQPPNVDVATGADVATFLDRLIDRVGGLAARRGG
jgi:purine nucleosidase